MKRVSILALVLTSALAASSVACSASSSSAPNENAPPPDEQAEEEVVSGVTKLASKLQDPDSLTAYGPSVYFSTSYGFATQEYAEYDHDIWVKTGSGRTKRLYKGLVGASWGTAATKNGIYEINERYASILRYALDGSSKDGETILHAIYGNEDVPDVGITTFAADDDGLVVGLRTSDDEAAPGDVVSLSPDGKTKKKLGEIAGAASALKLAGGKVFIGTPGGDVYAGARDGTGSLTKLASGEGAITSLATSGDDVFFASDKGIFVKRKGTAKAEKLLAEGASDLLVVRDSLLFGQYKKGISSLPLAGGAAKLALKLGAPSSMVAADGFVFATDRSYGKCTQTDEGQACAYDGSAYRFKF